MKEGVLRNFTKFTSEGNIYGKHLFNKVTGLRDSRTGVFL